MQQNPNIEGLVPLSDAHDFKVAEGNRDVRGWSVRTRDGEKVGKVNDLLVDTNALRARYVDVELDGGLFGSSRRVLIPVGAAQLGDDELVVDVARDGLNDYPAYDGSSLTRHPDVDASDLEVHVEGGEVTLTGTVDGRAAKRLAEDVVEQISGVTDIHNQIRVARGASGEREIARGAMRDESARDAGGSTGTSTSSG